jgi:UDP-glucuronate 4-epimerase
VMIEACKTLPALKHFVYASSSSIYGANTETPFSVDHKTDSPVSLYGATKKADELIMHAYAHLFRTPATGLRFFTVYGPWGRPDMAAYLFITAMVKGEPIRLFNYGEMRRDFTYVDDIVQGVVAALDNPPVDDGKAAPHRVYNLGNHKSERLRDFVACLERSSGLTAKIIEEPIQPGDVPATYADIEASTRDLGFHPTTDIATGVDRFVAWYRGYHGV